MHHRDSKGTDPTLAILSRWQDSLAMTEYFLRAHLFDQRISDEVRSAGMQVMGSANLSKKIVSGDHDVKNPVTTHRVHVDVSATPANPKIWSRLTVRTCKVSMITYW